MYNHRADRAKIDATSIKIVFLETTLQHAPWFFDDPEKERKTGLERNDDLVARTLLNIELVS